MSLVILCQSFQALTIGGIALFLPLIRKDLGLSFTQGGTLAAATTLVYALMQIPAGYLTDRFGAKKLFCIGILGTTTLSFVFGFVTEYWQALANQTLSGLFRSLVFASGLSLLRVWFPPDRRATAMGLHTIGGFSGNVVLDIVGPLLVASLGWRFPFFAFSTVGIITSLLLVRFGKEPASAKKKEPVNIVEALRLFRSKVMWVCGVIQYVRLAVTQGIAFWLPTLLVEDKGLSLQLAGVLIAIRAALIAPSNVIGGYVSDRLKNTTLVIGLSLLVLGMTTWLFVIVNNMILLIALIGINAVFVQMYFGPLFAVPIEILGPRTAGVSTGFSNFYANIGSLTSVYLLGVLRDATESFQSGFYAISAACVIGLGFTVVLAQMRRKAIVAPRPARGRLQ
ncbi:MAG: MFS transporter [Chloroflexi bacterium]|nr:MFS transporter [Chloroflexota bacterium]